MGEFIDQFKAGDRVAVVQQIPQRDGECWVTTDVGTVVKYEQKKTGSWYAHAKDERLWLDRLTIRHDDGEVVVYNLDQYTHVELAGQSELFAGGAPRSTGTEVRGGGFGEITGAVARHEEPGEGVPETPSGDLGQRQ